MDSIDERMELENKIFENKIRKDQVIQEIKRIEEKYGEDVFPAFNFQSQKKPWNIEYYKELKTLNISGAGSKEFILHLVDVRDYITFRKKIKFALITFGIIIVFTIILLMLIF